jgi:hypothetical protein
MPEVGPRLLRGNDVVEDSLRCLRHTIDRYEVVEVCPR